MTNGKVLLHLAASDELSKVHSRCNVARGSNSSSVDWECDAESRSWSSSASWSDDVEGDATSRLQQQLQDIDSVLYGELSPKILPLALRQEVTQWRVTFPHLRVCGTKPPIGPRPTEVEEGKEETYASHGELSEECDVRVDTGQKELREQLRCLVMKKLFDKVRPDISKFESKSVKYPHVPVISVAHQREPLLAHRQSAHKDHLRKHLPIQEAELGSILRVSPVPRKTTSRATVNSSRSYVILPPIEPSRGPASVVVFGRQSRVVQQKSKVNR